MPCYSCGALVAEVDGPVHRYIGAPAGCWALYGEVLARAAADTRYSDPHLYAVNSYAVQHPGVPGPQAIQSVAVHLVGLYAALELGYGPRRMVDVLRRAADGSHRFHWLEPPTTRYAVTIGDVHAAGSPKAHAAALQALAEATWQAWAAHHQQVIAWAAAAGIRP